MSFSENRFKKYTVVEIVASGLKIMEWGECYFSSRWQKFNKEQVLGAHIGNLQKNKIKYAFIFYFKRR